MSNTSSILSVIKKAVALLTFREKLAWVAMVVFAFFTATLEVVSAAVIVLLASVLSNPDSGLRYLSYVGISYVDILKAVPPNRIIFYLAIICGVTYFIKNIIATVEVFFQNFMIQKMNYNFKNKLLNKYAQMDYGLYLTRNSSHGLTVISQDTELMFSTGMLSFAALLSELSIVVFLVAMVVYVDARLAGIVFVFVAVLFFLLYKFLLPAFYRWGQKKQDVHLLAVQQLMQFFHGLKEVILFGKQDFFISSYNKHAKQGAIVRAVSTATNTLPRMMVELLFIEFFVLAISYMCLTNIKPQQMVGILGMSLYFGFRLMPSIHRIFGLMSMCKYVSPNIERVYNEYVGSATNNIKVKSVPDFRFHYNIVFKSIFFKYLNTEKNILNNFSLEIKKGKCIGIVGETGAGKSTLVDLLLGLLQPTAGEILIDGKYPVCSEEWHKIIGYVSQSIYLIDDTIEANIAFGESIEKINEVRLNKSIQIAQLSKFIEMLPSGVKTIIGERGIRLSGGEKQRIAIARALYREPQVLIFDEATSALDTETESKLMKTIDEISKNYTVVMVAHRISTLKNCDEIIQLSNGFLEKKILST